MTISMRTRRPSNLSQPLRLDQLDQQLLDQKLASSLAQSPRLDRLDQKLLDQKLASRRDEFSELAFRYEKMLNEQCVMEDTRKRALLMFKGGLELGLLSHNTIEQYWMLPANEEDLAHATRLLDAWKNTGVSYGLRMPYSLAADNPWSSAKRHATPFAPDRGVVQALRPVQRMLLLPARGVAQAEPGRGDSGSASHGLEAR
eukprot:2277165-Prymnesium_polylepis.2